MRLSKALVKGLERRQQEEPEVNYQQKYYALCEMHHELMEENKALRSVVRTLEDENAHLQKDIGALKDRQQDLDHQVTNLTCRQERCDSNRQFIDDATNYLGPMAKRTVAKIRALVHEIDGLEQMSDAYHSVGVQWPWQTS